MGLFCGAVIRQEVAVQLSTQEDQYTQGQLQYLGSHDSRTKINQDVKCCGGGCQDVLNGVSTKSYERREGIQGV